MPNNNDNEAIDEPSEVVRTIQHCFLNDLITKRSFERKAFVIHHYTGGSDGWPCVFFVSLFFVFLSHKIAHFLLCFIHQDVLCGTYRLE